MESSFLRAVILLSLACVGCSQPPFPMVKVNGTVTYEDGSLIPADTLIVRFEPQIGPVDDKTHPRAGIGYVNVTDGTFSEVTTHQHDDGVVYGKHRVLIVATRESDGSINTSPLVPEEYSDPERTPLYVDTVDSPFHFRLRKPAVP